MRITASVVLALVFTGFVHAAGIPLDQERSSLKFTGHAFLHDFNGEAKEFSGSAAVDPQKPELITAARIEIVAAKMTTFESGRDHNMFQWLHVDTIPGITFELTRVTSMDGKAAAATRDHPARFLVSGKFTLNKITTPLQTEVVGWREGKWLVVTGATQVDTANHGLPIIKQYFMTVDKEVDVNFRLVFNLSQDSRISAKP